MKKEKEIIASPIKNPFYKAVIQEWKNHNDAINKDRKCITLALQLDQNVGAVNDYVGKYMREKEVK